MCLNSVYLNMGNMNKHLRVIVFLAALNSNSVTGQSLNNTIWMIYNNSGMVKNFAQFKNDSIFFRTTITPYTAGSLYSVSGNSVTISDLFGKCFPNPGEYTFYIKNDTLKFTLLNDPCILRKDAFATDNWVKSALPTDIKEFGYAIAIDVFPNPSDGVLTIPINGEKKLVFIDFKGQIIKEITTNSTTILLDDLNDGHYFVNIFIDGTNKLSKKILVIK